MKLVSFRIFHLSSTDPASCISVCISPVSAAKLLIIAFLNNTNTLLSFSQLRTHSGELFSLRSNVSRLAEVERTNRLPHTDSLRAVSNFPIHTADKWKMIDEQKKLGCWSSRLVSSRLDNAPKVPRTPMMQISEARPCPRGSSMPMYVRCGRMQKKSAGRQKSASSILRPS